MPKATTKTSSKTSSTAAKPSKPAKAKRNSSPVPQRPTRKPTSSKEIMVQILLAKAEESKTFDWFELSQKLDKACSPVVNTKGQGKKGGGKKKKAGEEEGGAGGGCGMTGNELRDIYQEVILPSLRRGSLPWDEDESEVSTVGPITPEPVEGEVKGAKVARRGKEGEAGAPANNGGRKKGESAAGGSSEADMEDEDEVTLESGSESEYEG